MGNFVTTRYFKPMKVNKSRAYANKSQELNQV